MAIAWSINQDFSPCAVENPSEVILPSKEDLPPLKSTSCTFDGVDIKFPFSPYQCQRQLMKAIITSVNSHKNCLLESSTGSGKTLALLCSLLAWQRKQEDQEGQPSPKKSKRDCHSSDEEKKDDTPTPKTPIIYYATKTSAHINQIINQLRLTAYADTPMGIYATLDQTCNNHGMNSKPSNDPKNIPDLAIADNHYCPYDPNEFKWALSHLRIGQAWTIEDLKTFCAKHGACPYFELLNSNTSAKIIFCTYNYLLHPGMRQALRIDLSNNIVVFDEGHNVDELSREIASTSPNCRLSTTHLSEIISVLEKSLASTELPEVKREPLRNLMIALKNLRTFLIQETHKDEHGQPKYKRKDWPLIGILRKLGLCQENYLQQRWRDYLILEDRPCVTQYNPEVASFKIERQTMLKISKILFLLGYLQQGYDRLTDSAHYKIFVETTCITRPATTGNGGSPGIIPQVELHLICLNSSVTFKSLEEARSVIIASGTLSPVETLSSELGINFDTKISATPMIPPERVYSAILKYHSALRLPLNLSFRSWNKNIVDYNDQLAQIIRDICNFVPNGVVVFMTSRDRIEEFLETHRNNTDFRAVEKGIYVEPHRREGQDALNGVLNRYRVQAESNKGALLFALMRGRLSDGVHFRGKQARAFVTIGIPFLPVNDPFVIAKREYQDERNKSDSSIVAGWDWYCTDAFKALNQVLGRILRHSNDWAGIFVVDCRFDERPEYRERLLQLVQSSAGINGVNKGIPISMNELCPSLKAFVHRFEAI